MLKRLFDGLVFGCGVGIAFIALGYLGVLVSKQNHIVESDVDSGFVSGQSSVSDVAGFPPVGGEFLDLLDVPVGLAYPYESRSHARTNDTILGSIFRVPIPEGSPLDFFYDYTVSISRDGRLVKYVQAKRGYADSTRCHAEKVVLAKMAAAKFGLEPLEDERIDYRRDWGDFSLVIDCKYPEGSPYPELNYFKQSVSQQKITMESLRQSAEQSE
ncbi:MAG: hypothetical protein AAGI11_21895 [Pseudomonadota bacterium]